MSAVAELTASIKSLSDEVGAVRRDVDGLKARRDTGAVPDGAPRARRGENIMGSRGYSFGKMMAAVGNPNNTMFRDSAKIEMDLASRMTRKMYASGWTQTDASSSQLLPLWPEAFSSDLIDDAEYKEMRELLYAGTDGADPDEVSYLARKHMGYGRKAATAASPSMSWLDTSVGGSFVPPPEFGPPIELLRNKNALLNAGATMYPLGPSGRITMPRLTAATQGGWAGENAVQAPVNPGTGSVQLAAKKVIALVSMPNEILRFGSPAAEALVRTDLFKTVGLIADLGFLTGTGGDQPFGLINMLRIASAASAGQFATSDFGVNVITPTTANQLAPQDVYLFPASVEENNGEGTGWIMRPQMAYAFYQARASGDGTHFTNNFMFDWARGPNNTMTAVLAGGVITRTPQVPKTLGSGSQTAVLYGDWPDYMVAMFGAIEFAQSAQGYNLMSADQTLIRAILTCDGAPRHPGLFSGASSLNFVVSG